MNLWALIPLVSSAAYLVLLASMVWHLKKRANRIFALYIAVSLLWSLSAFMLTRDPSASTRYLIFWNDMVLVGVIGSTVAYCHFLGAFTGRTNLAVICAGYGFALATLALSFGGHVVRDAYMDGGYLHHELGPWMVILMVTVVPLLFANLWILAKHYRASKDPIERNRIGYLMVGWGLVAIYSPINANMPQLAGLPTDHLGTLANALIIGAAITRYQLLDIRLIARRALSYSLLLAGMVGSYVGAMMLVNANWPRVAFPVLLGSAITMSLLFAILIHPFRFLAEKLADRMFDRETYKYREMLMEFSDRMANVLDIEEVSGQLLSSLARAMRLTHADLLLKGAGPGDFVTAFSYPKHKAEADDRLRISHGNAVAGWLFEQKRPLTIANIDSVAELRSLGQKDRGELSDPRVALLAPIVNREQLIGMLALGYKQGGDSYRAEDIHLVMTMARQASIVIDNARLYAQAKNRANVDELTGLFNHRYLHQRINEEITRCSRFGEVFSLLFIDLDLFKCVNDIHGHAYGDMVLQKVGEVIRSSVRVTDIAFRYGGDEFSVLMPQTAADGAIKAAERIRTTMESNDDLTSMAVTCSVGIATWPADGVMREELIHASDSALYHAKQGGRNRICMASRLASDQSDKYGGMEGSNAVLNTIYALAATVDAKDHHTYGHSRKVSRHSADIATALGYTEERVAAVRAAGLLHDIGKIGVSDRILTKPGSLDDEEWEPIRAHPTLGVSIIKHVESLRDCLAAVQYHHERYDGSGYPSGLKGDNIPLDARILAVADSYDAMTSTRPYRPQMTKGEALEELVRCAGTHFDPRVVRVFVRSMIKPQPSAPPAAESDVALKTA